MAPQNPPVCATAYVYTYASIYLSVCLCVCMYVCMYTRVENIFFTSFYAIPTDEKTKS